MSTATEQFIEFRCKTCYQSRYEPVDAAGSEQECPYCLSAMTVPEAEPSRLCDADQVQQATAGVEAGAFASRTISNEEIQELAQQKISQSFRAGVDNGVIGIAGHSCDRWKRIVAYLIDGFLMVVVVAINFGVADLLSSTGICSSFKEIASTGSIGGFDNYVCYFGLVVIAQIAFWWSVATHGATPGKFVLCIRIVNSEGQPPGFVQGVVLRGWIAGVLFRLLPFLELFDCISLFVGEPPRCIHDYIAGTWVIDQIG